MQWEKDMSTSMSAPTIAVYKCKGRSPRLPPTATTRSRRTSNHDATLAFISGDVSISILHFIFGSVLKLGNQICKLK